MCVPAGKEDILVVVEDQLQQMPLFLPEGRGRREELAR